MIKTVLGQTKVLRVKPGALYAAFFWSFSLLPFNPMLAGLDPDLAWSNLELFAAKVLPVLRKIKRTPDQ